MKNFRLFVILGLLASITLAGCASINNQTRNDKVEKNAILARQASCEQFYLALDNAIRQENAADIQASQIKDYPFLSLNRFLVSFKNELKSSEQKSYWLTLAAKLNRQQRAVEWLNLSPPKKALIKQKHLRSLTFNQRLKSCSNELLLRLSDANIRNIIDRAQVKDDYNGTMRTLGLYPLTSLIVKKEVAEHHAAMRNEFNQSLQQLSVKGRLQRYVPDTNQATLTRLVEDIVGQENPLGIPFISSTTLNDLFKRYAPTLEIDNTGKYDNIGEIRLDKKGQPYVDSSNPIVYTMPSYTRFDEKILLQLNYFFWFPERPSQSRFDIYAGNLDGIIWRVTLDENLTPIIFDSVHNCGCYHQFYSTKAIDFTLEAALKEKEPPFLAQSNIEIKEHMRWVLRINSANHYVKRVYQQDLFDKDAISYSMKSYHQLRSLSHKNKNRNLFADNGIVKSSKRLERFLLWPMGISSPGAMRQWGHHATAFIGERYFDEPYLLDKFFKRGSRTTE